MTADNAAYVKPAQIADLDRHVWCWTGNYVRGLLEIQCDPCGIATMRVGTNWPEHIDGSEGAGTMEP